MYNNEDTSKNLISKDGSIPNLQLDTFRTIGSLNKNKVQMEMGKVIGTTNGGLFQPIQYSIVHAGETIKSWKTRGLVRIVAQPKVPTTDALRATISAYYVPMSYMITDYDERKANKEDIETAFIRDGLNNQQNGANVDLLPTAKPNIAFPLGGNNTPYAGQALSQTWAWKYKVLGAFLPNNVNRNISISSLLTKAYASIYNWYRRNKSYQPAIPEFKINITDLLRNTIVVTSDDLTSSEEKQGMFGATEDGQTPARLFGYGDILYDCVDNNYYTDIKPKLQVSGKANNSQNVTPNRTKNTDVMITGSSVNQPVDHRNEFIVGVNYATTPSNSPTMYNQIAHLDWQKEASEFRRRADDANKNPNDVIAELGGTGVVRTDRPQYLGSSTFELNYQQVAQTTPQNGDSSPLGTTGAYSVTGSTDVIFEDKHFLQDGIIMEFLTVKADNTYETSIHRHAIISKTTDLYNPELKDMEEDYLLSCEVNGQDTALGAVPVAYKKKYSEHLTLPNLIIGDVRTTPLKQDVDNELVDTPTISQWHNTKDGNDTKYGVDASYFTDNTDELIARNSTFTTVDYRGTQQILYAFRHEVLKETLISSRPVITAPAQE